MAQQTVSTSTCLIFIVLNEIYIYNYYYVFNTVKYSKCPDILNFLCANFSFYILLSK